jgi:hypothetical protein
MYKEEPTENDDSNVDELVNILRSGVKPAETKQT